MRSVQRGGEHDLTSEVNPTPEIDMPDTAEILARAGPMGVLQRSLVARSLLKSG